jgi:hypothetical protein
MLLDLSQALVDGPRFHPKERRALSHRHGPAFFCHSADSMTRRLVDNLGEEKPRR